MAHSKRQVWEAAKAAGMDDFIGKVSAAFGSDAIAGVAITVNNEVTATSDDMFHEPERVSLTPDVNTSRETMANIWAIRLSAMRNNPLVKPK